MPYSPPGVVAPSLPTPAPSTNAHTRPPPRPGHRRSYTFAADDPRAGPGAFSSLGALPRRTHSHSHAGTPTTPRKFHFGGGDVDDSSSSSDEKEAQLHPLHPSHQPYPHQSQHQRHGAQDDDDYGPPPPLRLRPQAQAPTFRLTPMTGHRASPPRSPQRSPRGSPNSSFTNVPSALSVNTLHVPVPFPRSASSSLSPLSPVPATGTYPTRPPGPSRTASTPIILSNGKPLKSSLKSSKSAPHVPSPGASGLPGSLQGPSGFHLRAQSAPSSPSLGAGAGVAGNWNGSEPSPPMTPKAVHFPAPDAGLEDIRLFKRSARPASVSFPLSLEEETETETETDRDAPRIAIWGGAGERGAGGEWVGDKTSGFPFPKVAPGRSPLRSQTNEKDEKKWRYELHAPSVPRPREEQGAGDMVRVERVRIEDSTASSTSNAQRSTSPTPELTLHGTLLVRNAAFEKHLFVRFTLDGWATTSEVGARYLDTVNVAGQGEEAGPGWDRFGFSIRLTDYAHSSGATPGHRIAGSLRGIGGSGGNGLGKGLEGRTLVLVARFFAPWVKEGGVGPYVWCDTLPPTAQTPATQAGAGTSPSGRPWIGQGGGGPGEWWDNNGGKNYDVGFRCVDVEEPAPSPPPVPAQVPAPQQNVIPFPTSSTNDTDAPPSQPEAPASPLPTSTPTHPAGAPPAPAENKPIPPPPPPRTAHAQALAAKLGRLSLRNYAAPVRPTAVPGALPVVSTTAATITSTTAPQPAEEKKATATEDHAPGTQSTTAVGLYWPWGRSSLASASPPAAPGAQTQTKEDRDDSSSHSSISDASDDEEDARRDAEAGIARRRGRRSSDETPPTSPLGAGGLLPVIEGLVLSMDEKLGEETPTLKTPMEEKWQGAETKEAKDVPLPASPPLASPPSSSPTPTPSASPPSPPMSPTSLSPSSSSSLLYKAFVRQWCFAGAGNGNGNGNAGTGTGTGPSAGMPSPLAAGR